MVEQQVEGSEYRLMIMNGRLFWAFERVPARVTGDGISSVRTLIEAVNLSRADNPPALGIPQQIKIDDEIEQMLHRRGQSLETVPASGEIVRLRSTPLSATGGGMVAAFDRVHPDNAELAVRAARLLRLDIVGVDFISPDVRQSWRENGGMITEVNAGPQIGAVTWADMHNAFLRELVGGDGRIPVAVVVGSETGSLEEELRTKAKARASRLGIASANKITIGGDMVHEGPISPALAARALTTDTSVEGIVWITDGQSVAANGLPFDRADLLAMTANQAQGVNPLRILSVIKDNLGEIVLEGGQGQASGLAQSVGARVEHANTQAQIVRKVLSIMPKSGA